jgi:hypothetical protein
VNFRRSGLASTPTLNEAFLRPRYRLCDSLRIILQGIEGAGKDGTCWHVIAPVSLWHCSTCEPITPNLIVGLVGVFAGIWIATTTRGQEKPRHVG